MDHIFRKRLSPDTSGEGIQPPTYPAILEALLRDMIQPPIFIKYFAKFIGALSYLIFITSGDMVTIAMPLRCCYCSHRASTVLKSKEAGDRSLSSNFSSLVTPGVNSGKLILCFSLQSIFKVEFNSTTS